MPHARGSLLLADAVRVFGGAERFVLDAARGLGRRGRDVTILAFPGAPLHRRALQAGLPVHTARTRANGAPWTVLPLALWLRQRRFDALLSVYDKDLRTVGLAAHLATPHTRVVHSRECDGPLKDRPWIRWFHRRVAARILVNSRATERSTLDSAPWLPAARVGVVPKGIDLDRFDRPRERDRDGTCVVGFAGQLVARKRVDALIDAAAAVDGPIVVRIAGEGPERAALERRARERGVDVRFDGFVTDMPVWYRRIDVFVLPSHVEGWGYAVAEAAAAGCAVLAHDASSVPEVVPEDAGAVLVPVDVSLDRALDDLVGQGPEAWSRRGESLRAHALRSLGLDRMLDDLENELFPDPPPPPTGSSGRS